MTNIKLLLLVIIFTLPQFTAVNAQSKSLIENVEIKNISDSLLIITFDIDKSKRKESFDISLEAKFQGGAVIKVAAVSGHIGNINGGTSKIIKWAIAKDIFEFNGFLNIKLIAESSLGTSLKSDSKLVRVQIESDYSETENTDPNNEKLADIKWIKPKERNTTVNSKEFSIQACVDSKINISEINIYINNKKISNDRGFIKIMGDCPNTIRKKFNLVEGLNEIRLEVIDADGTITDSFILVKNEEF